MTSSGAEAGQHWRNIRKHKQELLLDVRREAESGRWGAPLTEQLGAALAHPAFFVALLVLHAGWLVWNSGWLPVPRFDPPPFPYLALLASAEAPFLSLMILMHQRREQRVAELREEVDVQIALHTERQTTRLVQLLAEVHGSMGLSPELHDDVLGEMKQPLDPRRLVAHVREQLEEEEPSSGGQGR